MHIVHIKHIEIFNFSFSNLLKGASKFVQTPEGDTPRYVQMLGGGGGVFKLFSNFYYKKNL